MGGSLCFLDLIDYFLSHVGEVFNYNFFKNVLRAFLFFFFLWDPYNSNTGVFNIAPKVSEASTILFIPFPLFFSSAVISIILSSNSPIHSSASVLLLLVPSRVFLRLPTPVFWPGKFPGLYSPWGHKESDTTD